MLACLRALDEALREARLGLVVRHGPPERELGARPSTGTYCVDVSKGRTKDRAGEARPAGHRGAAESPATRLWWRVRRALRFGPPPSALRTDPRACGRDGTMLDAPTGARQGGE
jgi:hypothetical protein